MISDTSAADDRSSSVSVVHRGPSSFDTSGSLISQELMDSGYSLKRCRTSSHERKDVLGENKRCRSEDGSRSCSGDVELSESHLADFPSLGQGIIRMRVLRE